MTRGRPAIVNVAEVRAIREEYRRGARYRDLAVRHALAYGTVARIIRGDHPLAPDENLSRGPGRRRDHGS